MPTPPHIRIYEYRMKISVIILAAITPILCMLIHGYEPSLSTYWKTDLQPLFIIANASTSYYLYSVKKWKMSAFLLLMLTAFSVELYREVHDILAVILSLIHI